MVILTALALSGDPVGGSAAEKAARAELERGEYHRDKPGLFERAANWVGDRLDSLFTGGAGSHALLLLLVVIAVVGIVIAVRAGVPRPQARGRAAGDLDPLAPIGTADHRRLAARLAAEGRRAEALREWLRAAVRTIEDRGVLPPRPGRTGAATAREAGPLLPAAADELAVAMAAFDEVWFGGRTATDDDVTRAHAAADAVASARITTGTTSADGLAIPW